MAERDGPMSLARVEQRTKGHGTSEALCQDYEPPTEPDGGCSTLPQAPNMVGSAPLDAWAACWNWDRTRGRCPYLD